MVALLVMWSVLDAPESWVSVTVGAAGVAMMLARSPWAWVWIAISDAVFGAARIWPLIETSACVTLSANSPVRPARVTICRSRPASVGSMLELPDMTDATAAKALVAAAIG